MVSVCPLISVSSTPFINSLMTVPRAPITIGINITFMFHSFFSSFFSLSCNLTLWSAKTAKSTILQVLFFLLIIIMSGHLAEIKWSICMSKSLRCLCVSFSRTDVELCIYHLFIWSNLNFLHNSQWISLPSQLCLFLYSFSANLLHLLIMWLMVSSLSPYNLHRLFCCILSILDLIWLILTKLFCAVISFSPKVSLS